MYGTFYTQSEYKALENKLKRAEAKVAKQTETIKSLKAELRRMKESADNLSSVVFDQEEVNTPTVDLDQLNEDLDEAIAESIQQ